MSFLLDNIFENIFGGLENFFEIINTFFIIFCTNMKYIFAIILFFISIMTLFRFRGIYRLERLRNQTKKYIEPDLKDKVKQSHVILGMIYLCMSLGIFTNYFTYFLIWILDPLPDGFIFQIINLSEVNTELMNPIPDINSMIYPYQKTIYYAFAFFSFVALVQIFVSVWSIINESPHIGNPMFIYSLLFSGVIEGMLFGFTTCLPFFI